MVDLTGLNSFADLHNESQSSNGLQEIELDLIEEDPHNPRTEMDDEALNELAQSIAARGVKSPVSIRVHPSKKGLYVLNFGHRRLRASKLAGKTTIPAFIDEDHEEADQIIENIQRENLSTLDTARFIHNQLETGGKSKKELAELLGKTNSFISEYAVFFKLADDIRSLYDNGLCTSMQVLATLQRAYKKHPKEVADFCRTGSEFTRSSVAVFVKHLQEGEQSKKSEPNKEPEPEALSGPQVAAVEEESEVGEDAGSEEEVSAEQPLEAEVNSATAYAMEPKETNSQDEGESARIETGPGSEENQPSLFGESSLKNPVITISVDGRLGELLFQPSTNGKLWVQFDDGDTPEEMESGLVLIESITPR